MSLYGIDPHQKSRNGGRKWNVSKETNTTFKAFTQDWIKIYSQYTKISSVRARNKEMKHFISVLEPYQLIKISKLLIYTFT
jgi:hypothetical protein